jgi:hypothetical protein
MPSVHYREPKSVPEAGKRSDHLRRRLPFHIGDEAAVDLHFVELEGSDHQHCITGGMAIAVVNLLEAVEVEQKHGMNRTRLRQRSNRHAQRFFDSRRLGRPVSGS